jgi:hypothetical protein
MAKLTINDAARVAGVARSTLHRAINAGRFSVDPDGHLDTVELLRAGSTLPRSTPPMTTATLQDATPHIRSAQQSHSPSAIQTILAVPQEHDLWRMERGLWRRELEAAQARERAAVAREQEARDERQAAREREALLLRVGEQRPQRYDRLLDAPRQPATVPDAPAPRATPRRRGANLKAPGQACDPTRHVLGRLCPRGHAYQGTGQSLRRLSNHLCVACETADSIGFSGKMSTS